MDNIDQWQQEIKEIVQSYDLIKSFQQVSSWLNRAEETLKEADQIRLMMTFKADSAKKNCEEAENNRKKKSFLQRNFGSRKDEKEWGKAYEEYISEIKAIDNIKKMVKGKMDGIPDNEKERKEMLRRFSIEKKELNINKREVNEKMRQINAAARQARAKISGWKGESARLSRASITHQKENLLQPYEKDRASIEARLAAIDQEVLRLERIQGPDYEPVTDVKCQYCGREIGSDSVCPGCGATN